MVERKTLNLQKKNLCILSEGFFSCVKITLAALKKLLGFLLLLLTSSRICSFQLKKRCFKNTQCANLSIGAVIKRQNEVIDSSKILHFFANEC